MNCLRAPQQGTEILLGKLALTLYTALAKIELSFKDFLNFIFITIKDKENISKRQKKSLLLGQRVMNSSDFFVLLCTI